MSSVACRATVNVPEEFSEVIGRCATDKFQNLSSLATFVRHFSRLNCDTHREQSIKATAEKVCDSEFSEIYKIAAWKMCCSSFLVNFPPLDSRTCCSDGIFPPDDFLLLLGRLQLCGGKKFPEEFDEFSSLLLFFCRNSHAFCTRKLCEFRA